MVEQKKRKNKPMRRVNGQGSVYKLSGRRRRPWVAAITTGWKKIDELETVEDIEAAGKKRLREYEIIGYFAEKYEAEEAIVKHRLSPVSPKANMTLKSLYTEWSDTKYKYISKSTKQCYEAVWKRYKDIENVPISEIRTSHLQSAIDKEYEAGGSRSTLEKAKGLAYSLYEYAIQNDILNKNYAGYIILPTVEREEKEVFTDIEIKKLFDNVEKIPFVDTILILIYTGLRIAELLQLTKFNVDLEKHFLIAGVKTEAGKNRVVPIHDKIYPFIQKRYNSTSEYIVPNAKGGKMSHTSYRDDKYYSALRELGIRELNPHSCRHTCATLLAKGGADTQAIQKILGHTKYAFTADVYTHPDYEMLKSAMECIC